MNKRIQFPKKTEEQRELATQKRVALAKAKRDADPNRKCVVCGGKGPDGTYIRVRIGRGHKHLDWASSGSSTGTYACSKDHAKLYTDGLEQEAVASDVSMLRKRHKERLMKELRSRLLEQGGARHLDPNVGTIEGQ